MSDQSTQQADWILPEQIVFSIDGARILILDKDGMTYKGQRVEDGGEAHTAFLEVMAKMKERV